MADGNMNQLVQQLGERQSPEMSPQALSALSPQQQATAAQVTQSQEQQQFERIKSMIDTKIQQRTLDLKEQNNKKMQELREQKQQLAEEKEERQREQGERRLDLQERKAESLESLRSKKEEQVDLEIKKAERKQRLLDDFSDKKFKTNAGELSPGEIQVANQLGMNVKLDQPEVLNWFQNDDGTVSAVMMTVEGETDVREFPDLEGFQQFTDRTIKEMGPGQKTKARETAKGVVDTTSADWLGDVTKSWKENNPLDAGRLTHSKDADSSEVAEVQSRLTEDVRAAISAQRPKDEEIVVRDGPRGPGFYNTKGDFINKLPSNVDPKNVITSEEKPGQTKYSSPDEVRKAVKDGDISVKEGKDILVNNWPDRFE